MDDSTPYTPPKVWTWNKASGGRFASINRPIAGPTHEKELPIGKHPLQLYSLATPNGAKVTIMLEELLAAGHKGADGIEPDCRAHGRPGKSRGPIGAARRPWEGAAKA